MFSLVPQDGYFVRHSLNIASCSCLKELFGDPWTKTLQCLMCQIEVSFICSTGTFSERKTLELLTVSSSFEEFLPRLTFNCFCFICGTGPLVFICDYRKCHRLSKPYFFLLGECHSFSMCGLPHMSFNFAVKLSHLILRDCHTMLFH